MAPFYDRQKAFRKKIQNAQHRKQEMVKARLKNAEQINPDESQSVEQVSGFNSLTGNLTSALTNQTFDSLALSEKTKKALDEMGYNYMTEVQEKCISKIMHGKSVKGIAKTGSGKTLAFLIPAIELIEYCHYKQRNGTGVIIISPTREIAMQTYQVLMALMKYHTKTFELIIGGQEFKKEAEKLYWGVNILVCTPSRLLSHLQNTEGFIFKNNAMVVIDEADRIFTGKFEDDLKGIFNILPTPKISLLFSATKSSRADRLAELLIKNEWLDIDVEINKAQPTVETLNQAYLIYPEEQKFLILYSFLRQKRKNKMMIFFNNCKAVEYFYYVLNYLGIPCKCIHGKLEQAKRKQIFIHFSNQKSGTLLCTSVAARGWDIPAIDWIVQFDPPYDHEEYIHRVGRTARAGDSGNSLIFLREDEASFVLYLKEFGIRMNKLVFNDQKIPADIQNKLEAKLNYDTFLKQLGQRAFRSYLLTYRSHGMKHIFDHQTLDPFKVANYFGFAKPPANLPSQKSQFGRKYY